MCVQEPCIYLLWPSSVVIGNNADCNLIGFWWHIVDKFIHSTVLTIYPRCDRRMRGKMLSSWNVTKRTSFRENLANASGHCQGEDACRATWKSSFYIHLRKNVMPHYAFLFMISWNSPLLKKNSLEMGNICQRNVSRVTIKTKTIMWLLIISLVNDGDSCPFNYHKGYLPF